MSHFSQVKTKLKQGETLKRALRQLGFTVVEAAEGVEVRGFFGAVEAAEFKILTSTHYDIGFRLGADGNYECVGDWELLPNVSNIEREPFLTAVKRSYAKEAILELAEAKGLEVEVSEDETTGEMQMVVSQW